MNVDEMLATALEPVFPDAVFPNLYTGQLPEYVVWNYQVIPAVYAERAPHAARYLIQVHYYLPHKKSPLSSIQALARALFDAGCSWPGVINGTDSDGQHYILQCEWVDGGGYYVSSN